MSVRVMAAVWDRFPGNGSQLLAMLALADFGNDQGGSIHPSMSTIAAKIRLTQSQARRVVHNLIASDWISVVGNGTGGAPGSTRQYQINIEKLNATPSTSASPTPSAGARGGADARPRAGAREGSHPCAETASAHATQTITEPSVTVKISNPAGLEVGGLPPSCPHQKIIDLYHETLPGCPRVREWTKTREAYLRTRWRESRERQQLDWWRKYFEYIGSSDFLTGRTNANNGRPPFIADLEWLIKSANLVKVIEGKYHPGTT